MKKVLLVFAVVAALPVLVATAQREPAKEPAVSKVFKMGADCKVIDADEKEIKLADLKAGSKVSIAYQEDKDALVASSVRVHSGKRPAGGGGGARGEKPAGEAQKPEALHARGTITAVDATAGTLTADVVLMHGGRQ